MLTSCVDPEEQAYPLVLPGVKGDFPEFHWTEARWAWVARQDWQNIFSRMVARLAYPWPVSCFGPWFLGTDCLPMIQPEMQQCPAY
jgi:hypothetical protein